MGTYNSSSTVVISIMKWKKLLQTFEWPRGQFTMFTVRHFLTFSYSLSMTYVERDCKLDLEY